MGAPSGVLQPGPDTAAARQWPEGINPCPRCAYRLAKVRARRQNFDRLHYIT
ncbi:MAG: hypothetical protein KGZ72_05770 [Roseovarius sp.]|nr:hypothetical protein [Roseovarius sp.]